MDNHDQVTAVPSVRHVTVTHPPGNTAPVAKFTNTCPAPGQAALRPTSAIRRPHLDRRERRHAELRLDLHPGSQHQHRQRAKPTRTFTAPGTYTVQLIVTDEWGIPSAPVTKTVTITEPTNNVAPTPVLNPPSCNGLVCNFSGVGSADSNVGDTFTYLWDFADGTATSTSSAPSHTFPACRHLRGEADDDGRLGQGEHGDQIGDGDGSVATAARCRSGPSALRRALSHIRIIVIYRPGTPTGASDSGLDPFGTVVVECTTSG